MNTNITTEKEIKLKIGKTLPKGTPVQFNPESNRNCLVMDDLGVVYTVRITSAFNPPSLEELEEAVNDGICQSIAGESVEPDGRDQYNSPSWLLALGMI